jgi:uncharacterized protein (TIGR03083 family)
MSAPGIRADSSPQALRAQLGEVWSSLEALGLSLSDEEWRAPTPCPGWDVAAQYAHVIGTESMLLGRPNPAVDPGQPAHVRNSIGGFNEVWVAHLAPLERREVLELFKEVTTARSRALEGMSEEEFSSPSWTPIGQADYRRFMQIRVFDCWVHEQDVRQATARPGHLEGPAVEQSLDEVVRALGYIVGKKAGCPEGASVRFDITGPAGRVVDVAVAEGRARVVEDLAGPPTATLILALADFMAVACGRVGPEAVSTELRGDAELAQRVLGCLAFTI